MHTVAQPATVYSCRLQLSCKLQLWAYRTGGKGKDKGKEKGGATSQAKIPPHIGGWLNKLEAAGGRGRCRFWNAGNCIYGNQCNFEHRNLVDGSNRPAISTFAPGTAFVG